jgi:hypothetical protein
MRITHFSHFYSSLFSFILFYSLLFFSLAKEIISLQKVRIIQAFPGRFFCPVSCHFYACYGYSRQSVPRASAPEASVGRFVRSQYPLQRGSAPPHPSARPYSGAKPGTLWRKLWQTPSRRKPDIRIVDEPFPYAPWRGRCLNAKPFGAALQANPSCRA